MTTDDQNRWYSRLHARGYRLQAPPSALLRVALACVLRERSVLEASLRDTLTTVLLSVSEAPRGIAEEYDEYPPPFHSLCREEQVCCARTAILVFIAWLWNATEPPRWVLRETYVGERLHKLAMELDAPPRDSGVALARDVLGSNWHGLSRAFERIRQDLEAEVFPDRGAVGVVFDALVTVEVIRPSARELLRPSLRITRALSRGGPAGLYWPYMFIALERARVKSWPPGDRQLHGAFECFADDVATPICRVSMQGQRRPPASNRRRIHDARRQVLDDRLWEDWALDGWSWSNEDLRLLRCFSDIVDGLL